MQSAGSRSTAAGRHTATCLRARRSQSVRATCLTTAVHRRPRPVRHRRWRRKRRRRPRPNARAPCGSTCRPRTPVSRRVRNRRSLSRSDGLQGQGRVDASVRGEKGPPFSVNPVPFFNLFQGRRRHGGYFLSFSQPLAAREWCTISAVSADIYPSIRGLFS